MSGLLGVEKKNRKKKKKKQPTSKPPVLFFFFFPEEGKVEMKSVPFPPGALCAGKERLPRPGFSASPLTGSGRVPVLGTPGPP